MRRSTLSILLLALLLPPYVRAQERADPALLAEIGRIRAVDNHAREAGRLRLAVHVHAGGGCGHFFNLGGANPLLLESVLNDPTLRTTPEVSWEESAWLTNRTAREALALALTGMMREGDITRERALELARMVLRENSVRRYGRAR